MDSNSNQLDTTMIEFDHLPAPGDLNQELLHQIDSNIKGLHWSASYQCITMIRAICKYYPQHILDIFAKYGMTVLQLFASGSTQIVKNILKLLAEIFSNGQNYNVESLAAAFLPLLIKKAAVQTTLIREPCQEVLLIISKKCCYIRTIQVSTESSWDKNMAISQVAIKILSAMIMNIGPALMQINPGTLQGIMKCMCMHINGKRNNIKTIALDLCVFVFNQIGSENYMQLMSYSLDQQEMNSMMKAMEVHRTQKNTTPHLAEVLKQQKSQMNNNNRQIGNWGQNNMR